MNHHFIFLTNKVANDFLDLQQPVWITDMKFLDPTGDPSKIIVGTGHHQLRLYDIKAGSGSKNKRHTNRPIFNVEVGKYPIKSLSVSPDQK